MKKAVATTVVAAPAALAILFASPSLAANAYVPPTADSVITVPGAWIPVPDFIPSDWDNATMNPRIGENWYNAQTGVTPVVLNYHRDPILSVNYNLATGSDSLEQDIRDQLAEGKTNIVIASLSQGTGVTNATREKLSDLSDEDKAKITFIEFGSPFRGISSIFPNGVTIPGVDYTVNHPQDYGFNVTVVNGQYDGWADPPKDLLNPLASLNALMGAQYVHSPSALAESEGLEPVNVSTNPKTGATTTTYLVPTKDLPLTRPIRDVEKLLTGKTDGTDGLDRVLKPVIEGAYDRDFDGKADGPQKALDDWNKTVVSTTVALNKDLSKAQKQSAEKRTALRNDVQERMQKHQEKAKEQRKQNRESFKKSVSDFKKAVHNAVSPKKSADKKDSE